MLAERHNFEQSSERKIDDGIEDPVKNNKKSLF